MEGFTCTISVVFEVVLLSVLDNPVNIQVNDTEGSWVTQVNKENATINSRLASDCKFSGTTVLFPTQRQW